MSISQSYAAFEMNTSEEKHLVQYILVRSDLQKRYSHALKTTVASSSTSAIHSYSTAKATKNIDSRNSLHSIGSIVLIVNSESELQVLEDKLFHKDIDYRIWENAPQHYPACISLHPHPNTNVHRYLKRLNNKFVSFS